MVYGGRFSLIAPDVLYRRIERDIVHQKLQNIGSELSESDSNHDYHNNTENVVYHLGLSPSETDPSNLSSLILSDQTDEYLKHGGDNVIPTLEPALSTEVQLSLTATYVVLFSILFLFVYVQLWMIWWYRHKRLSHQTVFLFLCLVWAALRTTLFSFYFHDCIGANELPFVIDWLLYCFPVCIQFMTLTLLFLFFAQVLFKARSKYEPSKYKKPLRLVAGLAVLTFFVTNLTCAILVNHHESTTHSAPFQILTIRVGINDSLFVICGIALSVCIYRLAKLPSSAVVLEAKGTTVCQALVVCVLIIMLYSSRAVYNFIAINPSLNSLMPNFGFDWVNVSDQADLFSLDKGYAFVSFGIVLFVWEVLPTTMIVLFFRVKRPRNIGTSLANMSASSHGHRSYFFDNPRRYDSDEDLTKSESRSSNPSINGNYNSVVATPAAISSLPRGALSSTPVSNNVMSGSYTPSPQYVGTPRVGQPTMVLVHHNQQQQVFDAC